jgi:molybdenum-dependent DNA-binding transcriptional regulator ModE
MSGTAVRYTEDQVRQALDEARSITGAAKLLGVSRKTVWTYLQRYGIEVRRQVVTAP